ncbi:MAG: phosphopantetheinyl transferase [Proteobacteria bacterium]|nr:phosphopantetheinyl transferase [Pseudomonadota bacterium]
MTRPGSSERRQEPEIFFIDLVKSEALLDAEELRAPRLSDDDIERARTIADDKARRLWRSSRIATRILLERLAGESVRQIPFQIEPGGRPFLEEAGPHFSISHSGSAAVIAVARELRVGVDLEWNARPVQMSQDRRLRIIRAAERLASQPSLSAARDSDVLKAWVRLEAIAKARGTGIGRLLTDEGVIGGAGPADVPGSDMDVRDLAVGDAYVSAVAARHLPQDLEVLTFPTDRLAPIL